MEQINLPLVIFIAIAMGISMGVLGYTLFRFHLWSAMTLGIIVAYIIVNITYPIGNLLEEGETYVIAIYLIIEIMIPIYLFSALIVMLFLFARDSKPDEELDWKLPSVRM